MSSFIAKLTFAIMKVKLEDKHFLQEVIWENYCHYPSVIKSNKIYYQERFAPSHGP